MNPFKGTQRLRSVGVIAVLGALALVGVASGASASLVSSASSLAADELSPVVGSETDSPTPEASVIPEPSSTPEPSPTPDVPEPTTGPEPDEPEVCPIVDQTLAPTPLDELMPVAYVLTAYAQPRKACTIKVTWVLLTSLFKAPQKPLVGDTLEFDVDTAIPGKMKELVFDLAAKAVGNNQVGTVTVKCKVTSVDDGFDAITVTCEPTEFTVQVNGKPVTVKFPATTQKVTAGVSIVK